MGECQAGQLAARHFYFFDYCVSILIIPFLSFVTNKLLYMRYITEAKKQIISGKNPFLPEHM